MSRASLWPHIRVTERRSGYELIPLHIRLGMTSPENHATPWRLQCYCAVGQSRLRDHLRNLICSLSLTARVWYMALQRREIVTPRNSTSVLAGAGFSLTWGYRRTRQGRTPWRKTWGGWKQVAHILEVSQLPQRPRKQALFANKHGAWRRRIYKHIPGRAAGLLVDARGPQSGIAPGRDADLGCRI